MSETSSGRSAVVTGAAGFIGSHLAARLVREGWGVTSVDIAELRTLRVPLHSDVSHELANVRDIEAMRRVMQAAQPDVVFHLAAQISVPASMRDPEFDVETNVLGTLNVARAASEAGARRLVFMSTGGALFGQPDTLPVRDETPAAPTSVYGASKLAAEGYLRLVGGELGLEISVVRPGNVYGPAQDGTGEAGVVAIFAERMLRGEPATIFGDGSQERDYVYVGDVVEAVVRAAERTPASCLAATGVATSTRGIFDLLAELTGYTQPPVMAEERPGDIQAITLDAARAREVWGWEPSVSLREGLAETVDWFREALSVT